MVNSKMTIEENVTISVKNRKIVQGRYMCVYIYVFLYLSEGKVQQCVYIVYCEYVICSALYKRLCALNVKLLFVAEKRVWRESKLEKREKTCKSFMYIVLFIGNWKRICEKELKKRVK